MKSKEKAKKPVKGKISELEILLDKWMWVIIPLFSVIYFLVSKWSVGFYQDDEVAQYINMLEFWNDPFSILGNNPKPGYKLFTVLPALISYDAVLFVNALIASFTLYFTYTLLKDYKIPYAFLGPVLLAFQPLFFDLSFRSYSEIFTALCLLSFLILYNRGYHLWAAVIIGYIFTVRQEIALLILIISILYFREKKFKEIAAIYIFPILYNVLGYFKTGDPLFVLSEMQKVAGLTYKSQGWTHYFKVYIFIVGAVNLYLFILGFFGFIIEKNKSLHFKNYLLPYIIFIALFMTQVFTMLSDGPNPGNWRYLLHISPICAFFAVIGFNRALIPENKNYVLALSGILLVLTLAFLSKTTDGFILKDETDFVYFFILICAALIVLYINKNKNTSALLIGALAVISFFIVYQPRSLSSENIEVKKTSEFLDGLPSEPEVLANHSFLKFYSGKFKANPAKFKSLVSGNLNSAPAGTIIIWESHYGYRPDPGWGLDVPLESLVNDSAQYKLLKQFTAPDRRFASFVFEKK